MEKKIVPTLVSHFGSERKTKIAWVLLGLLCLGAPSLFAVEPVKKESALKEIASIEKRGAVNLLTAPSELVSTFKTEKKDHPKAWPLTYGPRFFQNFVTRIGSGVNDLLVLPWYARQAKDDAPLTRRFDMPDYAWQKE
jgi:hypothetical protein